MILLIFALVLCIFLAVLIYVVGWAVIVANYVHTGLGKIIFTILWIYFGIACVVYAII